MIVFLLLTVWALWALYSKSQAQIAKIQGAYELTHISALITLPIPIICTFGYFMIFYPLA